MTVAIVVIVTIFVLNIKAMSDMIKLSEAAALAEVSEQTIRYWIKTKKVRGELRRIAGIKKAYFVSKSDIEKLLSE